MNTRSITCLVGAALHTKEPLLRINHYRGKVSQALSEEEVTPGETFVTLVPPFHVEYSLAIGIKLGYALTARSRDPLGLGEFSINGMTLMQVGSDVHLVFPVKVSSGKHAEEQFKKDIDEYRYLLAFHGARLKEVPKLERPIITIRAALTKGEERSLRPVLLESSHETPMCFNASPVSLYIRNSKSYQVF